MPARSLPASIVASLACGVAAWPLGIFVHPLLGLACVVVPAGLALVLIVRRKAGLALAVGGPAIAIVVVVLAASAVVFKAYRVPSESMAPAVRVGDRVLLNRHDRDPSLGDVVVLHPPQGATEERCGTRPARGAMCSTPAGPPDAVNFIKRVVAGPGDRVALVHGRVVLNGKRLNDPGARRCSYDCDFPTAITIPPDHWFVLGDNRGASDDSRFWGPVPTSSIVGTVVFRYSPRSRAGTI